MSEVSQLPKHKELRGLRWNTGHVGPAVSSGRLWLRAEGNPLIWLQGKQEIYFLFFFFYELYLKLGKLICSHTRVYVYMYVFVYV